MKLIENKVWEYVQEPGIEGVYDAIASAARICYQTDTEKMKLSPKDFVEQVLLKNAHTRPLEFGTVYLEIPNYDARLPYLDNLWTKVTCGLTHWYVTTNFRVIMQGDYDTDIEAFEHGYDKNWLKDLRWLCEPMEFHYRRRTFSMYASRGVTDDFRTHVSLSSICESTRFCNYSKDKFGNELTGIIPYWIDSDTVESYEKGNYQNFILDNIRDLKKCSQMDFLKSMETEENNYMTMANYHNNGYSALNDMAPLQPQQLKRLFPLWVKAELRLCGFDDAWQNFFWRRCDGHADPECQKVSEMIKKIYNNE